MRFHAFFANCTKYPCKMLPCPIYTNGSIAVPDKFVLFGKDVILLKYWPISMPGTGCPLRYLFA